MAVSSWNDDEDAALQGLRPATQVIYLRALRRYVDYSTGVVGVARRICYQGLAEVSSFLPDVGSRARGEPMTKHAVRAAVDELARAGLVEKMTGYNRRRMLVFRLPLVTWDQSVQNLDRTGTAHHEPHTEAHTETEQIRGVDEGGGAQGAAQEPHTMNRTHPFNHINHIPDYPVDNSKTVDNSGPVLNSIPDDFSVTPSVRARCVRAGCPSVTDDQVAMFLAHHKKTGAVYADWQEAFFGWMLKAKEFFARDAQRDTQNAKSLVVAGQGSKKRQRDPWEVVPADDGELVPWAELHGFPAPGRTEKYFPYRQRLLQCVRQRRDERGRQGADCA